jgi:hypothetical protein
MNKFILNFLYFGIIISFNLPATNGQTNATYQWVKYGEVSVCKKTVYLNDGSSDTLLTEGDTYPGCAEIMPKTDYIWETKHVVGGSATGVDSECYRVDQESKGKVFYEPIPSLAMVPVRKECLNAIPKDTKYVWEKEANGYSVCVAIDPATQGKKFHYVVMAGDSNKSCSNAMPETTYKLDVSGECIRVDNSTRGQNFKEYLGSYGPSANRPECTKLLSKTSCDSSGFGISSILDEMKKFNY